MRTDRKGEWIAAQIGIAARCLVVIHATSIEQPQGQMQTLAGKIAGARILTRHLAIEMCIEGAQWLPSRVKLNAG